MKILDCTIRDGGYVNDWNFTNTQVFECYQACLHSKINYMEIGFRNKQTPEFLKKYGNTFFCTEKFLNSILPIVDESCKIAVMVTINQFDISDFVPKIESKISLVRVLMAYHGFKNITDDELDLQTLYDGVKQINQLVNLGYDVCFNIGRIDKLSEDQLYQLCSIISKTKIKYFYMADTYGSLDIDRIEKLIPRVFHLFQKEFNNQYIELGFHAHNNCSDATVKAIYSTRYGVSIIDGCVFGFGRGSGNAKTELLLMDRNKNHKENYDFTPIIHFGNKYIQSYKNSQNNLSYNIVYALCSYLGCHVTYAIEIIHTYPELDILVIYNTLLKIKQQNKHMFFDDKLFKNLSQIE